MPHIKINQPTEHWLGTTIEIDGKKIEKVKHIDYHVGVDEMPEIGIEVSGSCEMDFEADYIKLDISPVNVQCAVQILRNELSRDNPRYEHLGIKNELRNAFVASIASSLQENEKLKNLEIFEIIDMSEKILDRIVGQDK